MMLIGVLLAIFIERVLGQFPGWGRLALFRGFMRALQRAMPLPALWRSSSAPLLLLLAPVTLAEVLIQLEWGPFWDAVYSAAILLLCLGPRDLGDDLQPLMRAHEAGDQAEVARLSHLLMRGPQPDPTHRSLLGALFIQSHERLFGVLLWFFVLGPAGAVLYRLASRLPRVLRETQGDSAATFVAEALHGLLAWLPARFTALLFGLAGSLDDALADWNKLAHEPHEWRSHTWAILAEVGAGAVRMEAPDGSAFVPARLEDCLREVLDMQRRALLILLAGFALFTTGGML